MPVPLQNAASDGESHNWLKRILNNKRGWARKDVRKYSKLRKLPLPGHFK
jgi:hypothetical protein